MKASKKKGLGRGLESLLKVEKEDKKSPDKIDLKSPKATSYGDEQIIHEVDIEKIYPNKEQPRKVFNQTALEELTLSVKEQGIMQPIVALKKEKGEFEIIAGERRWRAAQKAGLKKVPVIIKKVSEQNKLELAIIENIQRDDLNPIEEGEAYQLLAEKYKLTQKEIAEKVGKERATVANLMRVTGLSKKVKQMVAESKLSLGHAKVLLAIESDSMQLNLAEKISRLNLSVRAAESMIKNALSPVQNSTPSTHTREYKNIEDQLKKTFGTKAKINENNGKGSIELKFHSLDQFNELVEKLMQ